MNGASPNSDCVFFIFVQMEIKTAQNTFFLKISSLGGISGIYGDIYVEFESWTLSNLKFS